MNVREVSQDYIGTRIEHLANMILTAKKNAPQAGISEMQAEIGELVCGMYGLGEEEKRFLKLFRKASHLINTFESPNLQNKHNE